MFKRGVSSMRRSKLTLHIFKLLFWKTTHSQCLNSNSSPPLFIFIKMPSNFNESQSEGDSASVDKIAAAKKKKKTCRHFAYELIGNAMDMQWEEHEVANLLILIGSQLEMDSKKMIKCLQASASGTPGIVVLLIDHGYTFTSQQLLSLFLTSNASGNLNRSISIAMENDLFNLNDEDTLNAFVSFSENMGDAELHRFVQSICEACSSKKKVGKVLHHLLVNRFTVEEAAGFIFDIVTLDFFLDVEGDMQTFYGQLGRLRERVQMLLKNSNLINEKGDIVASDEDDHGNLRDFVVGDEEVSYESDSDIEKDSRSSEEEEELLSSEESGSDVSDEEDDNNRRKRKREKKKKNTEKKKKIERKKKLEVSRSNSVISSGSAAIKKRKLVVEESEEGSDSDLVESDHDIEGGDVVNKKTQPLPSTGSKKQRLGIIDSSSSGSSGSSEYEEDSEQEQGERGGGAGKSQSNDEASSSIADSSSSSSSSDDSEEDEGSDSDPVSEVEDSSSSSDGDGDGGEEQYELEAEGDPHMNLNILAEDSDEGYSDGNEDSLTEQIDDEY